MEIVVVTGLRKNGEAIDKQIAELKAIGYQELSNPAAVDLHPADVVDDTNCLVRFAKRNLECDKFCMKTNSDHVINAMRVMKFKKELDVFKVIHYGEKGIAEEVTCEDNGEMSCYPDGFIDEWPMLLSQLV